LLELDSVSSSIYHIETALAQKRDPEAVITLALAYEHAGRAFEAVELLRRDGSEFSDNVALPIFEGVIAGRAKDYPRAIEAYNRALEIEPDNQDALFGLGDAFENSNRREDAIEVFRKLWSENSNDPIVANYFGYLLIEDNRELEFAGGLIEFALEKEPENAAYIDSYGW
jgi:tetratricopeptide (TPR) repeat protein